MMKKSILIMFISILSLLFVGCDRNETLDEENSVDNVQKELQIVRDFGLDFSDYEYYGYDDTRHMNEYVTGAYNEEGLPDGKWIIYYENGQISQEGYFENGLEQGIFTGYFPTYGNYIYYISGDNIIEQHIEKPENSGIEEEPTGWPSIIVNFKDGVENGLYIDYLSEKKIDTEESVIRNKIYIENGETVWTEIYGKRYSKEELDSMSDEEFDALFTVPDMDEGFYHLVGERAPLEGEEILEEVTEDYLILESLSDWENDGEAKGYTENPVWSGDELIKRGHMILWYPNGNLSMYTSTIGTKGNHIILDGVQTYYYENGNVGRIEIYDNDIQNGLFLVFDEDGEVAEVKYYKNGELKMDSNMPREEWSIDASDYYSMLLYNYLYCKNEWDGFPMQGERGIGKREDIANRFCKETVNIANIIGDYNGDSSLKEARINHTLGVIDLYSNPLNYHTDEVDKQESYVNELRNQLSYVEKLFKDKYGITEL